MSDRERVTWAVFIEQHPTFQDSYHKLFKYIPKLALETVPEAGDLVGNIIIAMMASSTVDADDILLLCSFDRYWGALKLLRSLYERTVTLKYLEQNPSEAEAFQSFDALDWQRIVKGIADNHDLHAKSETIERINKAADEARARFRQEPCAECKQRKQVSWTPHSSQTLAQRAGLGYLHFDAFEMPSKYIHPTYFGTLDIPQLSPPVYSTLKATHSLTLETVFTHQRHFKGDPLASAETLEHIRQFFSVWTYSETDWGIPKAEYRRAGLGFYPFPREKRQS